MSRAAFMLTLILIAALWFHPLNHAQNNSSEAEIAVRRVVDELFAAYAREDTEGYMKLWSAKSHDLAARRKALQDLFAANDKIEVNALTFRKLSAEGVKANARVAVQLTAIDTKSGKPASGLGRMNRVFDFLREEAQWKVWREAAAEDDLASALLAAKNEDERTALLAAEKDLMTVDLRKALIEQGNKLRVQGKYAQAQAVYDLTFRIAEQTGDKSGVASALQGIGALKYNQADYKSAFEHYEKSLSLSEAAGDQRLTANALQTIGSIHYLRGDYVRALEYYKKSLTLKENLDDKRGIAQVKTDIGSVHYLRGDYGLALESYRKGFELSEALGNKQLMANALINIGFVHSIQGDYPLALENYRKSLTLSENLENKRPTADALQKIGTVNYHQGNYGLALEHYQKSLSLWEALGDKRAIASAFISIGNVHFMQGSHSLALEHYQKGLALEEAVGNRRPIANTLSALGVVFRSQGDYVLALEYFQKSLRLSEELGDRLLISNVLYQIGIAKQMQGNYGPALEAYRKSLGLREELGDNRGISEALNDIAVAQYEQGDYRSALEAARRAVAIAGGIGHRETLWEAHTSAGKAYRALGQPELSRQSLDEAIATIEDLRAQVVGGELERQRFFENKVSPYYAMVELLAAQNSHREALAYAERTKSRVLLDVLHSSSASITKAMTAQEQEQERKLRSELVSLNSQISREKQRQQPEETRLAGLNAHLKKARLEYEAFQTSLYTAHPELRVQRGEAKSVTLEETTELLPGAQHALLEYVVTDEKTYLFVLWKADGDKRGAVNLKTYTLPIKRKELADHVAAFRQQLAKHDLTFRQAASRLYDVLVTPAQAELHGKEMLVIVPDGPLWELPFQALQDSSGRYLIEHHALSYTPSLTMLREMSKLRKKKHAASTTLLALGNPELGNETIGRVRLVHRDEKLEPLPQAEREVKTLAQLYGASQSKVYIGGQAREDRLKAEAGRFSVLHLATHGILNDASPMYSHLVLAQSAEGAGEDGLLEAWEIMKLDLNADLVVLSACETGRGRVGAGEGMIGLIWSLFVAGSPASVVSQWKVESTSTSQLMVEFHRNLLPTMQKTRLSKAKALQKAALKMLGTKNFRHPFYWAGFILVGDGS